MIERRNILDLIGQHTGKYHSCIITCYSFDFSFFEERVLPVLRIANIKNVNVLADGLCLEQAQFATTGQEFKYNKTYNFQPVYARGAFHPKIMLLTGVKHGLLLIGSGNISSCGLSTNDELWGAFHLDTIHNENASLFAAVWAYLQPFLNNSFGFISQKIKWIRQYSPWLSELQSPNEEIELESLNQSVSFVCNSNDLSIFEQLINIVPIDNLKSITVISPYYDEKGEFLKDLYNWYKPGVFNCVIEDDYGLIPEKMDPSIIQKIDFYSWYNCKKDYQPALHRLHAKAIHFQYKDNVEYFLLGSANATIAGLGNLTVKPINQEAGLILKRTSRTSWLHDLSIELPDQILDFTTLSNQLARVIQAPQVRHKIKLVYSELRGTELNVYTRNLQSELSGYLRIYSREGLETEKLEFNFFENRLVVNCIDPDNAFKVCFASNDEILSNFSIIHRYDALIKCNPDPNQGKLNELLNHDYPDGDGITELLSFIDHNWADEESVKVKKKGGVYSGEAKITPNKMVNHEKLSSDKFNTISEEVMLRQAGELTNANIRIAEFLGILTSEVNQNNDENYEDSSEQKLFLDTDQKGEGNDIPKQKKAKINGRKERAAISRYFNSLNNSYENELKEFYDCRALTNTPCQEIIIKVQSNMLVAFQIIQMYHCKKYSIEETNTNGADVDIYEEYYLEEGNFYSKCDSIKGFLLQVYGKYLLLSTAGFKSYDYELLNQKMNYNRRQVLYKAIFTILNTTWKVSEIGYRDCLLLNSLYFINPEQVINSDFASDLNNRIEKQKLSSKSISGNFDSNHVYFINSLLPSYSKWFTAFNNIENRKDIIVNTDSLEKGSIIFNRKIGFCLISKNQPHNNCRKMDFIRSGFEWNEEEKESLLEGITFPNKCILFRR